MLLANHPFHKSVIENNLFALDEKLFLTFRKMPVANKNFMDDHHLAGNLSPQPSSAIGLLGLPCPSRTLPVHHQIKFQRRPETPRSAWVQQFLFSVLTSMYLEDYTKRVKLKCTRGSHIALMSNKL